MGAQRLNAKSCRRIERATGQPVEFACANGGYVMEFVTPDHRHGVYDKRTGQWRWLSEETTFHFTNGCAPWTTGEPDPTDAYRRPEECPRP